MRLRAHINRTVAVLALVAIVGAGLWLWHTCTPRIVVRAFAPDGTELRVVQRGGFIMFQTEVFYRHPGGPWGRFYYDHEDRRWESGRAEVDTQAKRINLYRDERLTAAFEWESEHYQLLRRGRHRFEYVAQWGREPPL